MSIGALGNGMDGEEVKNVIRSGGIWKLAWSLPTWGDPYGKSREGQ